MHTMHMCNTGAQSLTVPRCEAVATFSVGRRIENSEAAIDSIKSCRLMFILSGAVVCSNKISLVG